jgi:integrase
MAGIHRLTDLRIKKATRYGRLVDGGGLYLQISKWGSKSWIWRYSFNGRARHMGLGPYGDVSLSEARDRAGDCRRMLRNRMDPIEERNRERKQHQHEEASKMTFAECAEAFISSNEASWKNETHRYQWRRTLEQYAFPVFGESYVGDIDVGAVLRVLEPIWTGKTETATRLRGRIENILDWGTVRGYRSGDNPARWRGHLDKILPKPSKTARIKHHPALPYSEVGAFCQMLRDRRDMASRSLEFLILTASRTSEVINATWDEIDLSRTLWEIPSARMKAARPHRVALSSRAVELLDELRENSSSDFIFNSPTGSGPLSNMAMLQLVKRSGFEHITVHGFRSTFRDWAAEQTAYPRELAEYSLAHVVASKTEAAYQRSDLFIKRQRLMEDWATYCSVTTPRTSSVTTLRA